MVVLRRHCIFEQICAKKIPTQVLFGMVKIRDRLTGLSCRKCGERPWLLNSTVSLYRTEDLGGKCRSVFPGYRLNGRLDRSTQHRAVFRMCPGEKEKVFPGYRCQADDKRDITG